MFDSNIGIKTSQSDMNLIALLHDEDWGLDISMKSILWESLRMPGSIGLCFTEVQRLKPCSRSYWFLRVDQPWLNLGEQRLCRSSIVTFINCSKFQHSQCSVKLTHSRHLIGIGWKYIHPTAEIFFCLWYKVPIVQLIQCKTEESWTDWWLIGTGLRHRHSVLLEWYLKFVERPECSSLISQKSQTWHKSWRSLISQT